MGQQQLLLIVLGIIIIGVAIAVSVTLFRQNAIDTKRDLVANECIALASQAIDFAKKPVAFGGGGSSFIGWRVPNIMQVTASGSYTAIAYIDSVVIYGTGNDVVSGTDSIKVMVTALRNSYRVQIIN